MRDHDPQEFLASGRNLPPALSSEPRVSDRSPAVAIVAAAVTGALAYGIAPEALGVARDGNLDEIAAAAVAACTYFASRLVAPHLCSSKKEQQQVQRWNIIKGGGAGATAAIPIALKVATDVATTGGVVTIMAILGGGAVWVYNRINQVKYCAYCQHKDSCDHIVCRNRQCLKLHFPMEKPLRCDESISLTWYALASQLQNDGLNYFESLELVRKHFPEWIPHIDGQGQASAIECRNFVEWREKNMTVIASFRGTVSDPKSSDIRRLAEIEGELKRARA